MKIEDLEAFTEKRYNLLLDVKNGIRSANSLADNKGIDHSNILRRLDSLEELKWINIERKEGSKSNSYSLTDKGEKLLEQFNKFLETD